MSYWENYEAILDNWGMTNGVPVYDDGSPQFLHAETDLEELQRDFADADDDDADDRGVCWVD